MTPITIHNLIDELHIPISHVSIEENLVYIGTVGTCLMKGTNIIESSLHWEKIFEINKEKLIELIYDMYQVEDDKLEITTKTNRVLELKIKGTEMRLPSVQYFYHANGEWTLQRFVAE